MGAGDGRTIMAWVSLCCMAAVTGTCTSPAGEPLGDAGRADMDGEQLGDARGQDAGCPATLVLTPLAFRDFEPSSTVTCGLEFPAVQFLRIWLMRDGVVVRDETVKCTDLLRLHDLESGSYEVAALGFVDGTPAGYAGTWPWFAVGGRVLAGVYEGEVSPCEGAAAVCQSVEVVLSACQENSYPLDLYCWTGVNHCADGCGV